MNSNLKDTISTICGIVFAICTALIASTQAGVVLPAAVITIAGLLVAVSGAIIGYLTGKKPDGTTKTPAQVASGNSETDPPIPPKG